MRYLALLLMTVVETTLCEQTVDDMPWDGPDPILVLDSHEHNSITQAFHARLKGDTGVAIGGEVR